MLKKLGFLILLSFCVSTSLIAATDTIKIGRTGALSGESGPLGQSLIAGSQAYIDKINSQGGVLGHKIEVITLDDGFNPTKAAENVRRLINQDKVFALVNNYGTPTSIVTLPIILEKKTLMFGTYSGAPFLRKKPPDRYVFMTRAGFESEQKEAINGLISAGIKPERIAFFIQNDAYGDEVYEASMRALKDIGYQKPELLPLGRYSRNTQNVELGLVSIMASAAGKPIDAMILAASPGPNTKFIKLAQVTYPHAIFVVGTAQIDPSSLTPSEQEKTFATEVVPLPDSDLPGIKMYREDIAKYGKGTKPDFVSLEGYLGTKIFIMALQKAIEENKLTKEGIIDVLESMHDIDLGIGEIVNFSKTNHQALHHIWPLKIIDGKFVPLNWLEIKKLKKGG